MAEKKKAHSSEASEKKTKASGADEGKTIAIVSYITLIGWVVALVMNSEKKNEFAKFHIRQSLVIMLTGLVLSFIPILGWILSIVIFVFWIMGLIYAINGQKKEVPVIGKYGQEWFKGI